MWRRGANKNAWAGYRLNMSPTPLHLDRKKFSVSPRGCGAPPLCHLNTPLTYELCNVFGVMRCSTDAHLLNLNHSRSMTSTHSIVLERRLIGPGLRLSDISVSWNKQVLCVCCISIVCCDRMCHRQIITSAAVVNLSHTLPVILRAPAKNKVAPIILQRSYGSGRFYALHFSLSRRCDGGAYLLSAAVLPSPPQRRAATHLLHLCSCSSYTWRFAWCSGAVIARWISTGRSRVRIPQQRLRVGKNEEQLCAPATTEALPRFTDPEPGNPQH